MSVNKNRKPKLSEKGNAKYFESAARSLPADQILREVAKNSFESHEKMRKIKPEHVGEVIVKESEMYPNKFEIIDNGIGMPIEKIVSYTTDISETEEESQHGNFGLGSKIAGFANNKKGMIWISKRYNEEEGSMCRAFKDSTGSYVTEFQNDFNSYRVPVDIDNLPDLIRAHKQGTSLTLCGNTDDQNTFENPPDNYEGGLLKGARQGIYWLKAYYNTKFFKIPSYVKFKVEVIREGRRNYELIKGHEYQLDHASRSKGLIENDSVKIHWWLLDDEKVKRNSASDCVLNGQLTTIHNDEVIEIEFEKKGVRSPLRNWGLDFSFRDVAIVVEPKNFVANQNRDNLTKNNSKLKDFMSNYREFFIENMPQEIKDYESEQQKIFSKKMEDDVEFTKEMQTFLDDMYFQHSSGSDDITSENLFGQITTVKGDTNGLPSGGEGSVEPGIDVKSKISKDKIWAGLKSKMGKQKGKRGIVDPVPNVEWVSNQDEWVVYNWQKNTLYVKEDLELIDVYAERARKQNRSKTLDFHRMNTMTVIGNHLKSTVCMIKHGNNGLLKLSEEERREMLEDEKIYKSSLLNPWVIVAQIVSMSKNIHQKLQNYEKIKRNEMEQEVQLPGIN